MEKNQRATSKTMAKATARTKNQNQRTWLRGVGGGKGSSFMPRIVIPFARIVKTKTRHGAMTHRAALQPNRNYEGANVTEREKMSSRENLNAGNTILATRFHSKICMNPNPIFRLEPAMLNATDHNAL
jgi:hypothetical protein